MASRALQINFSSNLENLKFGKNENQKIKTASFRGSKNSIATRKTLTRGNRFQALKCGIVRYQWLYTPSPMQCVLLNERLIYIAGRTSAP